MNGDVLRDAADPLHALMWVADWKHRIPDTTHRAVRPHDAILLNYQVPQQCAFHTAGGALPVLGMNGFGPIIASLITGPPPKTVKRRTQVLELACVDVQYPQNVGRMLRKLAKPLFLVADPLLCAFLSLLPAFALSDVECDAKEVDRTRALESGPTVRGNPTLHAVHSVDAIFNGVNAITIRIGALGNRRLDARQIVRMHPVTPQPVVDMGIGRQPPHGLHARVPFEGVGLGVPRVKPETKQIDGRLQPLFVFV